MVGVDTVGIVIVDVVEVVDCDDDGIVEGNLAGLIVVVAHESQVLEIDADDDDEKTNQFG